MEQNEQKQQFKCMGDCLNCRAVHDRKQQWWYCATQHAYNTLQMVRSMQEAITAMSGTIEELKVKIASIQDNEAMVFDPNAEATETDIAQEGDGAEE